MDMVALTENEGCHFRVPETGLMSKMDTRFQHPAHADVGHKSSLSG
jgi:hypothetical protein